MHSEHCKRVMRHTLMRFIGRSDLYSYGSCPMKCAELPLRPRLLDSAQPVHRSAFHLCCRVHYLSLVALFAAFPLPVPPLYARFFLLYKPPAPTVHRRPLLTTTIPHLLSPYFVLSPLLFRNASKCARPAQRPCFGWQLSASLRSQPF